MARKKPIKTNAVKRKDGLNKSNQAITPVKALVLLSGGLDSRLVVKMLEKQLGKPNVEAVFFALPFGGGCCSDRFCVLNFTAKQAIKLHIVDCTKGRMFREYMDIIRKPRFQRGTAMNPCIDCHLFMLKEAKKLAKKTGASIIATGEVLGERPLSQHKWAMTLIEKEAGLIGKVLRPLSAKLLPETEAEKKGWINRKRLLDIQGRRRVRQISLARKYKIDFPTPGGGCVLTDKQFSKRLVNLLDYKDKQGKQEPSPTEIELLKLGRHFRQAKSIIVVGRNEKENGMILQLAKKIKPKKGKDGSGAVKPVAILEVIDHMGPTTLVLNPSQAALRAAARLTVRYADAPVRKPVKVGIRIARKTSRVIDAKALPKHEIEKMRV